MPISFSAIPANWRVPLYWAEVDSSMAGLPSFRLPALLAGIMLPEGDAAESVPIPIATQSQADARYGQGSEMSRMFKAFFKGNFANEVWGVGCKAPSTGTKAVGVVKVNAGRPRLAPSTSMSGPTMSRSTSAATTARTISPTRSQTRSTRGATCR